MPLNQWVYIIGSVDGSTSVKYWVDGQPVADGGALQVQGAGYSFGVAPSFSCGRTTAGTAQLFTGRITRPALWREKFVDATALIEYDEQFALGDFGNGVVTRNRSSFLKGLRR